jgi:hypothetical protein
MVEALVNHWTIDHFFFGLGIALIISFLLKRKYPAESISLFILVLWELFEYREYSYYWSINYQNNIMDVIVGFIAVIISIRAFNFVVSRINHSM